MIQKEVDDDDEDDDDDEQLKSIPLLEAANVFFTYAYRPVYRYRIM
jgi:hypothetical protein